MFGFTGETVEEMNETIRYAFSIPFSKRAFVICLPLPGTRGYSGVLQKYGIQTIDWKAYNFEKPDLLPTAASLRQVRRAFFKAKFLRKFPVAACIFRIMHMSYVARLQKSIKEMAAVALSYGGIRDL